MVKVHCNFVYFVVKINLQFLRFGLEFVNTFCHNEIFKDLLALTFPGALPVFTGTGTMFIAYLSPLFKNEMYIYWAI